MNAIQLTCVLVSGLTLTANWADAATAAVDANYAKLPLAFIRAEQAKETQFVAQGRDYSIALEADGARLSLRSGSGESTQLGLRFIGGMASAGRAEAELPGKVNFYVGSDPKQWRSGLRTYGRVTYESVYPGIDVSYYGRQSELEFDLLLAPGADPSQIRLRIEGMEGSRDDHGAVCIHGVAEDGSLSLDGAGRDLRLQMPLIYQGTAGKKRKISGRYKVAVNGEVGFELDDYDRTQQLVIDPVFVYAGVLGASNSATQAYGVAVDKDGNAYVAGTASNAEQPLPLVNATYSLKPGGADGFILKLNSTGSEVLYSTYLGGGGSDSLRGIAVDSTGAVWVGGNTSSSDFPLLKAVQNKTSGGQSAFMASLDASGQLRMSTYFGGANYANAVAVDGEGNGYLAGYITPGYTIPATAGAFQTSPQGNHDGFVAKFTAGGALVYATYLGGAGGGAGVYGGPGTDYIYGLAVDSSGHAYAVGSTASASFSGAPSGGLQPSNKGSFDGFVAKVKPDGSGLDYFTFFGELEYDAVNAVAVDADGNAWIAGSTSSGNLPTTSGALQPNYGGGYNDAFFAHLNSSGSGLLYMSYLGEGRSDLIKSIALDSAGNIVVGGSTSSEQFPTKDPLELAPSNNTSGLLGRNADGIWSRMDRNLPGIVRCASPDPGTPGVVIVGTDAGVFRTEDGGVTWSQTFDRGMLSMSRSLAASGVIYGLGDGASAGTVYRSSDGGLSWADVSQNAGAGNSSGITADGANPDAAYIYGGSGVTYTTNGGTTWTACPVISGGISEVIVGTDGSVWVRRPAWNLILSSHGCVYSSSYGTLHAVAPSQTSPKIWYGIGGTSGAYSTYKSTDSGATWAATGPAPPTWEGLVVASSSPETLYVRGSIAPYLYLSRDGGASWQPAADGLGRAVPSRLVTGAQGYVFGIAPVSSTAFVSKLNTTGSALIYSTFLGASGMSSVAGVTATPNGDVVVAGNEQGAFPTAPSDWQTPGPSYGVFVVRVAEGSAPCFSTISPESATFGPKADSGFGIGVLSAPGCPFSATSDQPWLTILGQPGSGSGVVSLALTENTSPAPRIAHVAVGAKTVTIRQASSSCTFSLVGSALTPNGFNQMTTTIGGSGGEIQVGVVAASGCPWQFGNAYPASVQITPNSGSGTGAVTFKVGRNVTGAAQVLTFSLVGVSSQSLSVTQGAGCQATAVPSQLLFGASGGSGSLRMGELCATVTSGAAWIKITSVSPINGYESVVAFTVDANSGSARQAGIVAGSKGATIYQAASSCTYSLSKSSAAMTTAGADPGLQVQTPLGCPWEIKGRPDWITSTQTVFLGPYFDLYVTANTGASRRAVISVAGLPFTVTQDGVSPSGALAHLAVGDGWVSTITMVNSGTAKANARWDFMGNTGGPLALPVDHLQWPVGMSPNSVSTAQESIDPGSSLLLSAEKSTELLQGTGQFFTDGNVSGFAIFRYDPSGQEAVVPLETRNAPSYVLAFSNEGGVGTGVAVANFAAQAADIAVTIRGGDGLPLGTGTVSLEARGHRSFMLADVFEVTKATHGTIEFATPAGGRIGALGLRANGSTLTTIPVIAQVAPGGGAMAHLAVGDGWRTAFTLVNTGTSAAQAQLSFYDENGNPAQLPFEGRGTVSSINETLAPGASVVIQSLAPGALLTGSARLTTAGSIGGFAVFRCDPTGQEAVVPLETRAPAAYMLPFDNTGGLSTGIAIANLASQASDIPVTVTDDTGVALETATLDLTASGHQSFMLAGKYSSSAGRRGVITFGVPAGGGITVLGLRARASGAITTIPVLTK
jgi:hypothetical protein